MNEVKYKIIRSGRKSIALQVTKDLEVIIRVPNRFKEEQIADIVKKYEDWITSRIHIIKEKIQTGEIHAFREGEVFYYFGKPYKLVFTPLPSGIPVRVRDFQLQIHSSFREYPKQIIRHFFRKETAEWLHWRLPYWIEKTGLQPSGVKITWANKRWGSCNNRKRLNFSYRLCMLPPDVADYILVHELCHLLHLNHSKAFWQMVRQFCPDYKEKTAWLKEHGYALQI